MCNRVDLVWKTGPRLTRCSTIAPMSDWAYDFACDRTLDAIAAALNNAGPWHWEARESYWYGDYLNTRPAPGVRVRIHQYPQTVGAGATFNGPRDSGFMALLQLDQANPAAQQEVDGIFRELLHKLDAKALSEIEPYD